MADTLTREERSAHMARIKGKRTKPEMDVHGHLKGNHVPHRMWPDLPGRPDILIGDKTVVFVNGCFWHGCPQHFRCPKTNALFWAGKIERNVRRGARVARWLRGTGYKVVTVWEHDLSATRIEAVISRLIRDHGKA